MSAHVILTTWADVLPKQASVPILVNAISAV